MPNQPAPTFFADLAHSKERISEFLTEFLTQTSSEIQAVNALSADLKGRLLPFALNGKMIRGSLVYHMYSFLQEGDKRGQDVAHQKTDHESQQKQLLQAAAAFELIQAALLIHDDIMDNDVQRRGKPTIHVQYQQEFSRGKNTTLLGTSLAICLGDEALFLAMQLVASLQDPFAGRIMRYMAPEMVKTGLGQAQDVISAASTIATKEEILSTYLYKTAGYTFTIPLSVGALLAGKNEAYLEKISSIGRSLGLLFQLQDDFLGIFGDPTKTGKNITSDVAENKKTLIRESLFASATKSELQWLTTLFGNPAVTQAEVEDIQQFASKKGILSSIEQELDMYQSQVLEQIPSLELSTSGTHFFTDLTTYLRYRTA